MTCLRVAGALVLTAMAGSAHATTVVDFSLEDLLDHAETAVHVRVLDSHELDPRTTRLRLEVVDVLFGDRVANRFDLQLLTEFEGMPALSPGDEVVVFLNLSNRIERIVGLRWATYRIRDGRVFDHEWRPQQLRPRRDHGRDRVFLRSSTDKSTPGCAYEELKRAVREVLSRRSPNGVD